MKTFDLPDLGEGLAEAEVVDWHVTVGDRVVVDQPLVSVETDKAVVEIPSPFSGEVLELRASAGDVVKIGEPLVEYQDEGSGEDRGTVVGSVPDAPAPPEEEPPDAPQERASVANHQNHRVRATPAVRALARQLGVDLRAVTPSGTQGTISAHDVRQMAEALSAAGPAEPLRGVRKAMAQKMTLSHSEVVPATIFEEADIDAWPSREDVTIRLIQALVAGCRASPVLNSWYDSQHATLRRCERIDVAMAVDTPDGLFVPVMRDVANRDRQDLRRGLDALKRDVAEREIPLEEMRGATLTLSNFGVFGAGYSANLVVVPPQVAIVGAGVIKPRAVVRSGELVARRTLPVSVTFDHRVVTGSEAIVFLKAVIEDLQSVRPGSE